MPLGTLPFNPVAPPPGLVPSASNYKSSYAFLDEAFPDLAQELYQIRSRGRLNGFLSAMAMEEGVSADRFYWAEEGERHVIHENNVALGGGNVFTLNDHKIRPGIKILVQDKAADKWCLARVSATTANTFTADPYKYATFAAAGIGAANLTIFTAGSEWKKGANGQQASLTKQFDIYNRKLIIETDTYKINNSDLTNIAWFAYKGNYFWNDAQFDETMDRYLDDLEISGLTSEITDAASALSGDYEGAEGLFPAVRNRGITHQGLINTTAEWQAILKVLEKVHAESSYLLYDSLDQELAIDQWLASLSAYDPSTANYGIFSNNGADGQAMSLQMGFKGFAWGGYTFFKQKWNVLNDPTKFGSDELAASGKVNGLLFPYGNSVVSNPITGEGAKKVPYLTLMYKEMPGYSRKLESFFIGSGRIATPTTDEDAIKFNLRTERAYRVVGARKLVLVTG